MDKAKLFTTGRSQAVRLPLQYRFDGKEVYIRRDPMNGDVILSEKPLSWDDFFAMAKEVNVPEDFLSKEDRMSEGVLRDPFEGYDKE
jgi:antitoxin VapB